MLPDSRASLPSPDVRRATTSPLLQANLLLYSINLSFAPPPVPLLVCTFLHTITDFRPTMHDNEMDGFPREKINMAKNLTDMIVCEYRTARHLCPKANFSNSSAARCLWSQTPDLHQVQCDALQGWRYLLRTRNLLRRGSYRKTLCYLLGPSGNWRERRERLGRFGESLESASDNVAVGSVTTVSTFFALLRILH